MKTPTTTEALRHALDLLAEMERLRVDLNDAIELARLECARSLSLVQASDAVPALCLVRVAAST